MSKLRNEIIQGLSEAVLPHEVVKMHGLEGKSLVRAWREYQGLTLEDLASRLGISLEAYDEMEQPAAILDHAALARIAVALNVNVPQLQL